eukprot:scaffold11248_cov145-Skeletonema_menzelii.AAC.1
MIGRYHTKIVCPSLAMIVFSTQEPAISFEEKFLLDPKFWQAKAAAGEPVVAEKAATRLKVNSADAKEAGRRNRDTMVTLRVRGRMEDSD